MYSIIVYLLFGIIGYTLADIFGDSFSAFSDIRYWIILFSAIGIQVISLNMQEINVAKKRVEYFENMVGGIILDVYETKEFTEIVCRRGSDVITYRVYGNEALGYSITERQVVK